ncbi:MAG: hypothetical protein SFU91_12735 [Chloroherpetonaceae bacterium]|nr:hypothetical protein [Chloroherpetonaceae bacterium]
MKEKRPKRKLNSNAGKSQPRDWLKPALRSSIHEFNQAITAFGFTASSLSLIAQQVEHRKATDIKRELLDLSVQMKEAELRYKRSVQVLDYFTSSEMRAERISLQKSFEAVFELFQTFLRKHKVQVTFECKKEIILECLPEKMYRMWAFLLIAITEQYLHPTSKVNTAIRVKIVTKQFQKDVRVSLKCNRFGNSSAIFTQMIQEIGILRDMNKKNEVVVDDGHCKLIIIFEE